MRLFKVCAIAGLLVGCVGKDMRLKASAEHPMDVVVVPGCPSLPDGRLSGCQWDRAIWAAHLWDEGLTEHFITSGSAVYGRHIESEGLKAGMVALGVPAEVIYTDTQALHTDENVSYSMRIADELGFERVGAASQRGQAAGMVSMMRGWGQPAAMFPMKRDVVMARVGRGIPEVRTEPVPESEWMPLDEREEIIAERRGHKPRAGSFWIYVGQSINGTFGNTTGPVPPVREPTLDGERYRNDREAWTMPLHVTDVGRSAATASVEER